MRQTMKGYVYLYHFDYRISNGHTTQHYIGYCDNLHDRDREHRRGKGARLTQVATERGIGMRIVRAWHGNRALERRLKKRGEAPRLCPVCSKRPYPVRYADELTREELKDELIAF